VKQPMQQASQPMNLGEQQAPDSGGWGDTIVCAAFVGTCLLVCLYAFLGLIAKLWH